MRMSSVEGTKVERGDILYADNGRNEKLQVIAVKDSEADDEIVLVALADNVDYSHFYRTNNGLYKEG